MRRLITQGLLSVGMLLLVSRWALSAPSTVELAKMQDYVNNYVDTTAIRHSFHAHEGFYVDCVDIMRQPSMLTPAMSGQPIAQPPPLDPSHLIKSYPNNGSVLPAQTDAEIHASETDENRNLRQCPEQTIPIRRITMVDLLRFSTMDDFYSKSGTKLADTSIGLGTAATGVTPGGSSAGYQYAVDRQYVYHGGMISSINIWNPYLESTGDHTISQIWAVNNMVESQTQTAESGWARNPAAYGDNNLHYFIFWTADDYQHTGCYDLRCAGFVQTNNTIVLGSIFPSSDWSTPGGQQYEIQVAYEHSGDGANWWLLVQGIWVGYYPASLYPTMQYYGNVVQWGGEVYNSEPSGRHTKTQMGSGAFAESWYQYAADQRNVWYIDLSYTYQLPTVSPITSNSGCYDSISGYDGTGDGWNTYLFFGGPGYSTTCP